MEVNSIALGSIGHQNGNTLSTVRANPPFQTPEFPPFERQPGSQSRKLRLQYEQLMRKKALKKKIEAKQKNAQHRLQEIKSKQLMNFTQNQKKWHLHSQEKKNQSPKNLRSKLQNICVEQRMQFNKKGERQKQNFFEVYHKAQKCNELPKIRKERIGAKNYSTRPKNQEIDLISFGIFSEKSRLNVFLKKFRSALQNQFVGGLDLQCEHAIQRLQHLLLGEVGSSLVWLTNE